MDSNVYRAILKTICYADIFDYPLKEEEVCRWIDIKILRSASWRIKRANGVIIHKNSFMFLKGREDVIAKRLEREVASGRKLAIAKGITSILKYIPTIKLIGVSGSVAASNADQEDDIDMFVVSQTKTVWLTRLLTTIVVELLGKRRRPGDLDVADKICLNMFVDENYLTIPKERQNLYTAYEVCQLKVLYDRDDTYKKFLIANSWVREFLPNAVNRGTTLRLRSGQARNSTRNHADPRISAFMIRVISALERFAKHAQLYYMRKRRTTELVSEGMLAFHPKDYTADVLTALEERLRLYGSQV